MAEATKSNDQKKAAQAAKSGTTTQAVAGRVDKDAATGKVDANAPAGGEGKSIVNSKYRDGRYKLENQDWLGKTIAEQCTDITQRERKVPVEGEEGAFKVVKEDVNDGVNVDKLFKLARENGLNVDKYDNPGNRASHGFAGRARMTVRNMLQAEAKRRHGLVIAGKFQAAPADWLQAKGAADKPTHDEKGNKIPVPKPPKADKAEGAKEGAKA